MDKKKGSDKIDDLLNIDKPAIDDFNSKKRILRSANNQQNNNTNDNSNSSSDDNSTSKYSESAKNANVATKKRKIDNFKNKPSNSPKSKRELDVSKPNDSSPRKCTICKQHLDNNLDLRLYRGHPEGAVEEYVALIDPKLLLFTDDENDSSNYDQLPHNRITCFSVYDKNGHLCQFDQGLIENNVLLYFSGYVKAVYEDDPSPINGIPVRDVGPIDEWWVSGYESGEKAILGFSTGFGQYYLMEPTDDYRPFMDAVYDKVSMSKIIIEYLINNMLYNPSYGDLLNHLQNFVLPTGGQITEETLLKHAQFICDQVQNIDTYADEDEVLLLKLECMQSLIKLVGVWFDTKKKPDVENPIQEKMVMKKKRRTANQKFTKATTTELVRAVFENYFPEQIDQRDNDKTSTKQTRCGTCASCQAPNCGRCAACRSNARNKKQCIRRSPCENNLQSDNESDSDNVDSDCDSRKKPSAVLTNRKNNNLNLNVHWHQGPPIHEYLDLTYYNLAIINNQWVSVGDFVKLRSQTEKPTTSAAAAAASSSLYDDYAIGKIITMFENEHGEKLCHVRLFCRGTDTILQETSDKNELFLLDECGNYHLGMIVHKMTIIYRTPWETWFFNENNRPVLNSTLIDDGRTFFYRKRYNKKLSRFEDIPKEDLKSNRNAVECTLCQRKITSMEQYMDRPISLDGEKVFWRNEWYQIGSSVYLLPNSFEFHYAPKVKQINSQQQQQNLDTIDEDIYPEFYRKKVENKNTNNDSNAEKLEPFCIGIILDINEINEQFTVKVQKFYRPENLHKGTSLSQQLDLNLVYWSDEEVTLPFEKIVGKCYVAYEDTLDTPIEKWSQLGPNRFYFNQKYDATEQKIEIINLTMLPIGRQRKYRNLFTTNKKSSTTSNRRIGDEPNAWPMILQPLRTLDLFAGCGGLSEGLHQSGVAETKWAIEKDRTAAMAFKLNNPETIVYTDDCNKLLHYAMDGRKTYDIDNYEVSLPRRGDVELLVGGPPCQGFSGMNRFNATQYSLFKNSLIVTFLSYCDYYRPKFILLENVRNFAVFKKGLVLKLTLRCLLAMGYQCTFGILQAGNYGVPQIRRRLILLAAAPGEILPRYPEPTHVMDKKSRATQLDIVLDNCRYTNGLKWVSLGAPYRTITVRDAMSDLPAIKNGCKTAETTYEDAPQSHFQRILRGVDDSALLYDHICKEMAAIVEARMSYIPTSSGSDWRDLPNIVIRLSDGTYTRKLEYNYHDRKNGKNALGKLRGVCPCVDKKPCDQSERQFNTLIPWCLPHTANRHNQWAGLYGRLEWDGVFPTTVTIPEPMAHQGKVIHPVQHRVVSVRESARSQGFPDKYKFYGNIMDKYRQIGNAVPPPLACAIGKEILNAVAKNIQY